MANLLVVVEFLTNFMGTSQPAIRTTIAKYLFLE